MSSLEAKLAVGKILRSGFRHHAYEDEKELLRVVLTRGISLEVVRSQILASYGDWLEPGGLRLFKTGFVCFLTVLSRTAIEYGADSEYSFAMSDYYLGRIEGLHSVEEVEPLFQEVIENYQELAEETEFCGPYFSKLFKEEVGVPPQAYIESCRLEEARRVLAQGQAKVVEIAEALGFCNASYFAKRYKMRFGMQPSSDGRG